MSDTIEPIECEGCGAVSPLDLGPGEFCAVCKPMPQSVLLRVKLDAACRERDEAYDERLVLVGEVERLRDEREADGIRIREALEWRDRAEAEVEKLRDGRIGTVLGILCNVRDALTFDDDFEDADVAYEVAELQRAIDFLKPLVFPALSAVTSREDPA